MLNYFLRLRADGLVRGRQRWSWWSLHLRGLFARWNLNLAQPSCYPNITFDGLVAKVLVLGGLSQYAIFLIVNYKKNRFNVIKNAATLIGRCALRFFYYGGFMGIQIFFRYVN